MMAGSCTAAMSPTVRTPSASISSTTRSLWTSCPRIAPRPPPAAKRFTLRSAMRTPEQKPYFSARLIFIGTQWVIHHVLYHSKYLPPSRQESRLDHGLKRGVATQRVEILVDGGLLLEVRVQLQRFLQCCHRFSALARRQADDGEVVDQLRILRRKRRRMLMRNE